LLFSACVGCSGESSSTADGGEGGQASGGSATGGVSGTSTGGNGGSARPAKLGLYLRLQNPTSGGGLCPAGTGIEWDIGAPILSNGMVVDVDSPTPTDFGSTLEDGELDTEITCSVTADGSVEISGGGVDPVITPPNGRVNFSLAGTASPANGFSLIDFSVYTPVTFSLRNSGAPACAMTTVHEVHEGALWADFDCPALGEATSPDVSCHANGTIVVEYCATE
jgi:hypothetical protein